jgi:hypothetical protein
MARDYYPLIARAVAGLEHNAADARQIVYEHARRMLRELVGDHQPALLASERIDEMLALEEAIWKVEFEVTSTPDEPRGETSSMIRTWRRWLN